MSMNVDTSGTPWTEKYRPRTLDEIKGQDRAVKAMEAIIREGFRRPPLLAGPPGDGKTSLARIAGSVFMCESETKPCLNCISCRQIIAGGFAQDASFGSYKEYEGGWLDEDTITQDFVRPFMEGHDMREVIMIDEVQELPPRLQGMLLKPLEMSASRSSRRFILCTSDKTRLTKALVQRCDVVDLKHVSAPEMGKILKGIAVEEKVNVGDDGLTEIIFSAGGHVREAVSKLQGLHREFPDQRIGAAEVLRGSISKYELAARLVCQIVKCKEYAQELTNITAEVMGAEIPALIIETLCNAVRIKECRKDKVDHLPERYREILAHLPEDDLYMFAGLLSSPDFQGLSDYNAIELFLKSVTYRHRNGHFSMGRVAQMASH